MTADDETASHGITGYNGEVDVAIAGLPLDSVQSTEGSSAQ
jgi:hypothetical protein